MSYSLRPEPKLKVWGAPSLGASVVEYSVPEVWGEALREVTWAFVQSASERPPPPITGADNMRVLEAAEAAYRSAREERRVKIELAPAG